MELNYEETIRRIAEREKDDLDKYIDSFKKAISICSEFK